MFVSCLILTSSVLVAAIWCHPQHSYPVETVADGAVYSETVSTLHLYQFLCNNGEGLDGSLVCNGENDCVDGTDENQELCKTWDCHPLRPFKCESDGICMPVFKICNGVEDCYDGSDEDPLQCGIPGVHKPHKIKFRLVVSHGKNERTTEEPPESWDEFFHRYNYNETKY